MATLTKSTGTVTLSGAVEKVTFPAVYGWVWVKNMSDADMFVGLSEGISAGADGVMRIPAGDAGRIQTDGQDSVYLIGSGNALVVAQNYADCPFKLAAKGGEIPDLSAYAKKTDVPNIKVNAAVDADTLDNLHASSFALKTDIPASLPANGGNADTVGGKLPEKIFYDNGMSSDLNSAAKSGCYSASPETLNIPFSSWWLVETMNYNNQFIVQKAHVMGDTSTTVSYIRNYANGAWSDWTEIYTAGNKPYVTGSATVAANSQICVTNHGFMPSAAIWWDSNGLNGVAVSFDDSQFIINVISTDKMTINYMIFK